MIGLYLALLDDDDHRMTFENLYMTQREQLTGLAYNILNDIQLSEDAVSETFFYIAKRFSKLGGLSAGQLKAYSAIAVKNISRNMLRSVIRETAEDIGSAESDSFMTDDSLKYTDRMFIRECIMKLSYDDREIFMLYYVYRYSLKEIAALKGMKYAVVQKRIQKARKQLRIMFEEVNANGGN